MKTKGSSQLWWVMSLLAIAVVLPTVCLLWFMSQAVKNERLVVRQKLEDIYQVRLTDAREKSSSSWLRKLEDVDGKFAGAGLYESFSRLVIDGRYDGLVVYDDGGERIFPLLSVEVKEKEELVEEFGEAWGLEFTERNFVGAIKLYERKTYSQNEYIRYSALIGKSRCLYKLGRLKEAVESCKEVALADSDKISDSQMLVLVSNARVLLLEFLKKMPEGQEGLFEEVFEKLVSLIYSTNKAGLSLPADSNMFIAQRVLGILKDRPLLGNKIKFTASELEELIAAEERSVRVAEHYAAARALGGQADRFRKLMVAEQVHYGLQHKIGDRVILVLLNEKGIVAALGDYESSFRDSDITYRIFDDTGDMVVGGSESEEKPFVTASLSGHFEGWNIGLYFGKDGGVFDRAAKRQVAIYIWSGVLVIVLILASGGFAGRVVSRQIKLNKLKNDFIATISHELKTPLSSIRLLVDTLLEGNYSDQKQAAEYLHLTSKENERLSRLVDNFLTFSRMERNKQAFELAEVRADVIASNAVDVVRPKFGNEGCEFDVNIDEDLPAVLADSDAMVTVLVNLLDNAYKYSYDEKKIGLKVFAENNAVCFQVSDNGEGMSRRVIKRIFKRFYQADRTLSRQADGCGLGLSIVKFIVDAHKGQISVDSQPGKGSTFTVRLPAVS